MGMTLLPIKNKTRTRNVGERGSSRKGVRELKNLKCNINYEKGRGASHKSRVLPYCLVINEDSLMERAGVGFDE